MLTKLSVWLLLDMVVYNCLVNLLSYKFNFESKLILVPLYFFNKNLKYVTINHFHFIIGYNAKQLPKGLNLELEK